MRNQEQRTFALPATKTTRFLPIAAAFAGLLLCGCAAPVSQISAEIPKKAMPAAIESGIDTMSNAATRRRLEQILASQEMRDLQRDIVAGLLDGTLNTLSDKDREERMSALTTRALTGTLRLLSAEVAPLGAGLTRGAVNGALDAALNPARSEKIADQLGLVMGESVEAAAGAFKKAAVAKEISSAMTDDLGPAMKKTLAENVGPGLAAALQNEEFQRALGTTARTLGRELTLGVTEALAQQKPPPDTGSVLSSLTGLAHQGAQLFGSAAWLLVLVICALFAWIVKLLAQARRYRADADRRAQSARLLEDRAHDEERGLHKS
ncbi:MAG: hypothetical protein U0441_28215 [Polyangiaceae bacterium]